MSTYNVTSSPIIIEGKEDAPVARTLEGIQADLYKVGFNPAEPAQNDQLVVDAEKALDELVKGEQGGRLALVNGPASLPVAMVLAHSLGHRYSAVACFDPKLGGYVVAMSHGGEFRLGQVIAAANVVKATPA